MFKKLFGKEKAITNEKIVSPVTGVLIKIEEVPDPVFAQKMMGEGVGVQPTNGIVVAPVDGEIIQIAEKANMLLVSALHLDKKFLYTLV